MTDVSTWTGRSSIGSRLGLCLLLAWGTTLAGCNTVNSAGGAGQAGPNAGTQSTSAAPAMPPMGETTPAPATQKIPGASATVGLLVPLSGPNAALGQALMQSAEMALFETGDDTTALVVRDTEAIAGPAAAAQSAIDQGANILLGPVFAAHAKLVGPVAAAAHVPVVAFTNDKSVAGGGLYVMGILPQIQIDREIAYASSQGFKRIAALLPDTPYGHTVADAIGPATALYGASQAQVEFYQAGAFDYSPVIEKLAAEGPFDALLIPDSGVRLHLIVPLLAFYNIDTTKVKLLGSGQWTDPSLLKEPALIGAWFAAPSNQAWTDFDQRYRQAYGNDPPRIASLSYDAMIMAGTMSKMGNFGDSVLTRSDGFTGIDGAFRFQPDGLVERKLDIIEIQTKGFVVKDPAPKNFQPVLTN